MRNTRKSTRGKRLMIPPNNLSNGQNGPGAEWENFTPQLSRFQLLFLVNAASGIPLFRSGTNLPRQFQIAFPKQSTTMAGGDPAAPHRSAPALAQGQLHGHLVRCRSRGCQSQQRGWSTAAWPQSLGQ